MQTVISNTDVMNSRRWYALALLCAAQFIVIMDTSIIGVALPAIKADLGYSQNGLQWIFNAYVVVFGGLLLLGGRLSDLFGARKIFMYGFGILTLASLLAGMAVTPAILNTARGLQGLGAALIAPAAMTLLMTTFTDPKELGKAFGFWGASAAAGGSAGVFLGGVITEWLNWSWVFYINIPIGLLVLALAKANMSPGAKSSGRIDWKGAVMVTLSLILFVYAIVNAANIGWMSEQTIGTLTVAAFLMLIFIITQKMQQAPLLPLSIFKTPNLSAGNLVMGLMAAAWIPLWFFLNLYLQQILELNAFRSGLALLPMTMTIMIVMIGMTEKLIGRFGFKKVLVTGLLCLTASLFLFSMVTADGSFLVNVLPASLLGAVGMSLAYIPGTIAAMSGAKPEQTGLASGIVNTSYQVGSAIGLAIIVVIASAATMQADPSQASMEALNNGFRAAFRSAAVTSLIAGILALFAVRTPKQK